MKKIKQKEIILKLFLENLIESKLDKLNTPFRPLSLDLESLQLEIPTQLHWHL